MNMNNESRDSQSVHNIHIIEKTADFFMFLKEVSYAHQGYLYLTKNLLKSVIL